jgi:hypothetical protein
MGGGRRSGARVGGRADRTESCLRPPSQREAPRAEVVPPTGDLLVAPDGALWVERTDLMDDPGEWEFRRVLGRGPTEGQAEPPTVWDRFDAEGERLQAVLMPPRFRPFDLESEDAVLGVLRDEMDIEYVARLRVR